MEIIPGSAWYKVNNNYNAVKKVMKKNSKLLKNIK